MKTLNNYIMASSLCALGDSLVTGQKFGLDPQTMIDVLNVGTVVNFPTMDTFRRDTLPRTFNSGFGLGLLVKDLGICEEFMAHNKFETQLPGMYGECDSLLHQGYSSMLTSLLSRCPPRLPVRFSQAC
ncbi:NAD-binding of NADP-dependent 3-hydroxyisobutyrate dehydrogenase-domain-containing protein [Lophiotrema nucula]|uniref:NAD-binding of NADP-dependent 3-hydroxyisobutyrate dehydrogenase-domain-containing protein n=1 Tax=Lophiotrema nucula TaxID=690887 RepID=A0A6A5YT80_9PLEO|nr:NAD-binding of NADP-dependent 3-hydroxyisobutyrate dehydrogenase-domain-containing protein [Lophiotrema nucula]